ncbi:hypothetical protein D3C78_1361720 [compost metagenome]
MLGIGHVAKAVFPIDQADQALGFQLLHQVLAHLAIQHGVGFLFAIEQEGQVEHTKFLDHACQRRGGTHHHFLCAAGQGALHLFIGTQRGGTEGPHLQLAVADFFKLLRQEARGAALDAFFVQAVAEADQARLDVGRRGHAGHSAGQRGSQHK